ncbi:MAG: hypothetical protein GOU97_01775 [Nanoarchaeota archaeon]|nr:hypothetical protein [Nanoarchaeota archaeon]
MSYKDDPDYIGVNKKKNKFFIGQAVPRTAYYVSEFLGFISLATELVKVMGTLSFDAGDPLKPYSISPIVDLSVANVGTPLSFMGFGLLCYLAYKTLLYPKYEEYKEMERTLVEVFKKSELEKKLRAE